MALARARRAAVPLLAMAALALVSSCASAPDRPGLGEGGGEPPAAYPRARFAVMSDPHVFDPGLGASAPSFVAATIGGRTLYAMSAEILATAVDRLIELAPDFVLVAGDLTKEGEARSHALVAAQLERLRAAGIAAYVLPGNHDIANPRASRFEGESRDAAETIGVSDFAAIYADFGFGGALSRDSSSLSYVARLAPGLRLLTIDPFKYPARPYLRRPEPRSELGRATMAWIRGSLDEADRAGDRVIAMLHQSLLEHFPGQGGDLPGSMIGDAGSLGRLLASRGVRLAFTGHLHVQDAARARYGGGGEIYDICTGALSGYPLPFRQVELDGAGLCSIATERVASVPSCPEGLAEAARLSLERGVAGTVAARLAAYGAPWPEAALVGEAFGRAHAAWAAGDEAPVPGAEGFPKAARGPTSLLAKARYAKMLNRLWRDAPPADNDLTIDLR